MYPRENPCKYSDEESDEIVQSALQCFISYENERFSCDISSKLISSTSFPFSVITGKVNGLSFTFTCSVFTFSCIIRVWNTSCPRRNTANNKNGNKIKFLIILFFSKKNLQLVIFSLCRSLQFPVYRPPSTLRE